MIQNDIDFVRNTLEYALSQINRTGSVSGDCLRNLEVAVSKLKGRPDFVEDHPSHSEPEEAGDASA